MRVIIVASGKGGTGKTKTSTMLARAFAEIADKRVALLDLDTNCPNLPKSVGIMDETCEFDEEWFYPRRIGNIQVFSSSFLFPADCAMSWSGDKRMSLINELLTKVKWDNPDILICDAPPGTGDETTAVLSMLDDVDGVIIVTTGARESVDDAKRLIALCNTERYRTPIIGVIENMGHIITPNGQSAPLFHTDVDYTMELNYPVLDRIPFNPLLNPHDYENILEILLEELDFTDTTVPIEEIAREELSEEEE